jgi:hypothetical protein
MNERIEQCLYLSGLTAQGCWDELDDYAKQGIHKFTDLIVRECAELAEECYCGDTVKSLIFNHFGIEP